MENWLPPNFISVLYSARPLTQALLGTFSYSTRSTDNTLDRVDRAKKRSGP
jgi:hypothetical protein